ncbi:hypothetical protein BCV69DRAFT_171379 [Microstroma glucosiphilum]|uniref:Uncharacterized protein n=1 Tax=Pseudomicrostroma glucosiphilum TaxID=1684307 RepID=A0A316U8D6_9BASI|nr:hypothetical protein BCV69DRAFT_171379 [Pseudomicrostroma glucosiphilum]PWN21476.1 hypothetical protein BCV69DRAFT_171379 [Pseudomicrostroma glucosiphilum]
MPTFSYFLPLLRQSSACSDVNYCGGTHSTSSDMIVAASAKLFQKWGGGTKSKLCGQSIVLTARGKAVNATIQDECPECAEGSIDMSPAVFKQLAGLGVGVLGDLQWAFAKPQSDDSDEE